MYIAFGSSKYRKSVCKVGLKYNSKIHAFFVFLKSDSMMFNRFKPKKCDFILPEYNVLADHNTHLFIH